jgi:hypothetical protein
VGEIFFCPYRSRFPGRAKLIAPAAAAFISTAGKRAGKLLEMMTALNRMACL